MESTVAFYTVDYYERSIYGDIKMYIYAGSDHAAASAVFESAVADMAVTVNLERGNYYTTIKQDHFCGDSYSKCFYIPASNPHCNDSFAGSVTMRGSNVYESKLSAAVDNFMKGDFFK